MEFPREWAYCGYLPKGNFSNNQSSPAQVRESEKLMLIAYVFLPFGGLLFLAGIFVTVYRSRVSENMRLAEIVKSPRKLRLISATGIGVGLMFLGGLMIALAATRLDGPETSGFGNFAMGLWSRVEDEGMVWIITLLLSGLVGILGGLAWLRAGWKKLTLRVDDDKSLQFSKSGYGGLFFGTIAFVYGVLGLLSGIILIWGWLLVGK